MKAFVLVISLSLAALLGVAAFALQQQSDDRPVYGIAQISIHDREGYRLYEQGFMPIWSKFGGEMLAVSEAPEIVEGEWDWTRTVLLRFESKEMFHAWFDSAEYQELVKHRHASSKANLVVIEGR